MKRSLIALAAITLSILPATAQDLQKKGVSYWGQPAAQKLYTQPAPGYRTGGTAAAPAYSSRRQAAGVAPASGSKAALQPGATMNCEIMSHGLRRTFLLHIPANYSPSARTPVIMAFHGLGMNGSMMRLYSGLNSSADRAGFIVLYPDAYGGKWDDGMRADQADDVDFVKDMLARVSQVANVDQQRIYACGLSNGGYFCQRLACDMGNRIAALAVVASTGFQNVLGHCSSPSIPIVMFMGTDDPLVPREGENKQLGKLGEAVGLSDLGIESLGGAIGKMGGMYSAQDITDYWVKRNGCSPSPREQTINANAGDGCKVKLEGYGGGRNEVAVYTIENGGHTWPGAVSVAKGVMGRTTYDISASDVICQFFRNH